MSWTAQELEYVVARVVKDEYSLFLSAYVDYRNKMRIAVTLTKSAGTSLQVQVKGEGDTVNEAFEKALCNFPRNPVDGVWDTHRLAAPFAEATYTELE